MTTTDAKAAAHIAEQIKASGVTIVWLCEKTGIPRTTMTRLLAGHASFSLNQIDRIAAALRLPVADLLPVVGDVA